MAEIKEAPLLPPRNQELLARCQARSLVRSCSELSPLVEWPLTTVHEAQDPDDDLGKFSLAGLTGPVSVVSVYDGDTLHLEIFVDLIRLDQLRTFKKRKKVNQTRIIASPALQELLKSDLVVGYQAVYKCRLAGVDAAELKTRRGPAARSLLEAEARRPNIHARLGEFDKYERLLVELFYDENYTRSLNRFLVTYADPQVGRLCVEYDGGKKSDYFTFTE